MLATRQSPRDFYIGAGEMSIMWNIGEKGVRIPSVPGFEVHLPETFADFPQIHRTGPQ